MAAAVAVMQITPCVGEQPCSNNNRSAETARLEACGHLAWDGRAKAHVEWIQSMWTPTTPWKPSSPTWMERG